MALATATAKCLAPFFLPPPSSPSSFPSCPSLWFFTRGTTPRSNQFHSANQKFATLPLSSPNRFTTRFSEYKFPDPIPEFADAETEKFRNHLLQKLSKPSKKDTYGESVEEVVGVCTEIFSTFLHSEYGGPGTLLVIPFIDMADAVSERGLPGGPQAARAAVKWAQSNVDKDWREWNGGDSN
ncbi:Protein PLASTID REDOX INSENSITIVE 2, chloroplastic [Stylosanthes scabra]|uniref:Protein PLASTID REDOX INSENSITIVE 2, chloroplastic n=1 Tax=Stylosanthes scabra TaxID=79078 RepID=A0ABU6XMA4_9FABA|nr:Protein PLASTID REDOX INSENSITIVE 2, chloroplastic [Stylosanthes scabra]